ncbi:MAG: hypothetical protein ACPGNV_13630 [Mangrovicoccus sp.]
MTAFMLACEILPQLYFAACIGVCGFQVALIFGAPWGPITQGGQHSGALPLSGRVMAGLSIALLLGMGFAILSAAGRGFDLPIWSHWAALAVQTLSMILNWITPSKPERRLWGPITTILFAMAAWVVVFC